ncbi:MAG: carbon-nitrogen hydrolase family protein [bacterium]|nr:carbon-nitrogen hydrolase family protein [bacterium]
MNIALVQQHAGPDPAENFERGFAAAEVAISDGAELICFAELAFTRFWPQFQATPELVAKAEPIPGPTTDAFCALARKHGVVIVPNLFEQGPDVGGAHPLTYDSSPVIDGDGTILGITRMIHITDYEHFHEQGFYTPGDTGAPVYDTWVGRLGVAICYDRHYPEYMRALAVSGAELVIVPQAGAVGEWPEGLYEAEMRVAAFQNGYYTALCNRVGEEEHLTFAGESFVCGPDGRVLARAGEGTDEILHYDVDMSACRESHARKLFLRDRRPDLYGEWLNPK